MSARREAYAWSVVSLPFFISYFVAPRATLGHWWGGSLTHLVLITTSFLVRPEFHQEPRNDMSNDIFREVFMIGGKRYVGATFNKNKLNVICNIFNLIKYFSWKPKFWCAKYRCTIMKVDLKYYFVNDEGFLILEKTALGEKYFIKKVVSVNTIFFNVFFILSDMKPKDCFAYIIHFLFCKTYAVYYISYVVRL